MNTFADRFPDGPTSDSVEEYLALRDSGVDDAETRRRMGRLEKEMDALYWCRVEEVLLARVSPHRPELAFSVEERLLVDMGLLDARLIPGERNDLGAKLGQELAQPGPPNHFYLSEWLEDRYRQYRLTHHISSMEPSHEIEPGLGQVQVTRRKVLRQLGPLFDKLPGVNRKMSSFAASGRLDEEILTADINLLDRPRRPHLLHRRRLLLLRSQILQRARGRARGPTDLKLFDALDNLYSTEWRERFAAYKRSHNIASGVRASKLPETAMSGEHAKKYLRSELHFVKTLMPLGALAGGVTSTQAVMLDNGPRVTKADTSAGLTLVESCDREFDLKPVVLIAPFRGRGIFEWDRDSLVVSLRPVENAVDSVANAAGNRRMLIDSFHGDGEIRAAYEDAFPGDNYQQSFQADYRAWVTSVGRGERGALSDDRRAFFRQRIGPDAAGIPIPPNMRNLGPQTRKALGARFAKQIGMRRDDANVQHRLGVLLWMDDHAEAALRQFARAAALDPDNGMILLGIGLLLQRKGEEERARALFERCCEQAPHSIWRSYAEDALEGKL